MSSAMLASSIDHVGEIRNHAGRECKWHADMASAHVGKSGGFLGRHGLALSCGRVVASTTAAETCHPDVPNEEEIP
jgi:hypothetical protein